MRLRTNLALAAVACAVTLLGAEGACRLLYDARLPRPRLVVDEGEPREWCCGPEIWGEIHNFTPNTSFKHCYDRNAHGDLDAEGCVTYLIDSRGYRYDGQPRSTPDDAFRIVVLGDSFTFGEGVRYEQTFAGLLQAEHGTLASGRAVDVVNLGVPGEDTEAEIRTYVGLSPRLSPDVVVLQWTTNDFPHPAISRDHEKVIGARYREVFVGEERHRWSHLVHYFWTRLRLKVVANDLEKLTVEQVESAVDPFAPIARLRDLVRADGARFVVLVFPELIRFDDYPYAGVLRRLTTFLETEGIEHVDLLPALSRHRDRDLWVHESDHHPNSRAHRIAFEALRTTLR